MEPIVLNSYNLTDAESVIVRRNMEERDCTTCKWGFVDERYKIPMCHHPERGLKDCDDSFSLYEGKED